MIDEQPYQHALVFSGGGARYGYYLGWYAAALRYARKPDLIVASCGGAIAAALVRAFPTDPQALFEALASKNMYRLQQAIQPHSQANIATLFGQLVERKLHPWVTSVYPDIDALALFDIADIAAWLALLPTETSTADSPDWIITAGKLLYAAEQQGHRREPHGDPLYAEQWLTTSAVKKRCAHIAMEAAMVAAQKSGTVLSQAQWSDALPLASAVRASIGDIGYLPTFSFQQTRYIGGMVNLFPLALAKCLAQRVSAERKAPFNPHIATPLFQRFFGVDPNQGRRHFHALPADHWLDTSDNKARVPGVGKRIDWLKQHIALRPAVGYSAYRQQMETQWRYGFQRAVRAYLTR
ncbi:patatin-like phospholipase family protein [Thaumasiovibrio subtropicus]|uniref:patatin-like phospholipase family protein n=1 Tax=Thaumasiovibrio subtropicus TaxID=1891207 RepID=UPI000B35207E|nr:patatin-like phospholipase family protein [Thaumasiovibrio subtropicus]